MALRHLFSLDCAYKHQIITAILNDLRSPSETAKLYALSFTASILDPEIAAGTIHKVAYLFEMLSGLALIDATLHCRNYSEKVTKAAAVCLLRLMQTLQNVKTINNTYSLVKLAAERLTCLNCVLYYFFSSPSHLCIIGLVIGVDILAYIYCFPIAGIGQLLRERCH